MRLNFGSYFQRLKEIACSNGAVQGTARDYGIATILTRGSKLGLLKFDDLQQKYLSSCHNCKSSEGTW